MRSSAKPLFDLYWRVRDGLGLITATTRGVTYLSALQIHQIIANLKKHADQIYEWNVVPVGDLSITLFFFSSRLFFKENVHVSICGTACHHELDANSKEAPSF